MASPRPRYEWRGWAERLDGVAGRVRGASDRHEIRETTERYIVSRVPGANPKVRYDRLDIKVLRSLQDGFQQWDVALKVPFPVAATVVAGEVLPLLGAAPFPLARPEYGYDELFDDVVDPHPDLAGVEVRKRREFFTVGGCTAEIAEVAIGGRTMQTAAVESIDLDLLREAWRSIGLDRYENISYPAMIRRVLGWVST